MKRLRRNLLLGIIIIAASISGYFLKSREMQSYVVETETNADDIFSTKPPSTEDSTSAPERADGKININTASLTQLELLEGIGPEKAKRIIRYREEHGPFEVIEDIMKIDGIGKKTFEKIKDSITVE